MAKKKLVNSQTENSEHDFIDGVANSVRQADARTLLALMQDLTGKTPKLWGKSIIGFGKYSYQRKNGDEFEWFNVGFSPGKAHMTIYVMYDINTEQDLLTALGPHETGRGCLYIKRLEHVNMDALKEIIKKSDRW